MDEREIVENTTPEALGLPSLNISIPSCYPSPPEWARPANRRFGLRVYPRKQENVTLHWLPFSDNIIHYFGSDPALNHFFIGHPSVKLQHACILWHARKVCGVMDMQSHTGTKVNGKIIDHEFHQLEIKDDIRFGESAYHYQFDRLPDNMVPHDIQDDLEPYQYPTSGPPRPPHGEEQHPQGMGQMHSPHSNSHGPPPGGPDGRHRPPNSPRPRTPNRHQHSPSGRIRRRSRSQSPANFRRNNSRSPNRSRPMNDRPPPGRDRSPRQDDFQNRGRPDDDRQQRDFNNNNNNNQGRRDDRSQGRHEDRNDGPRRSEDRFSGLRGRGGNGPNGPHRGGGEPFHDGPHRQRDDRDFDDRDPRGFRPNEGNRRPPPPGERGYNDRDGRPGPDDRYGDGPPRNRGFNDRDRRSGPDNAFRDGPPDDRNFDDRDRRSDDRFGQGRFRGGGRGRGRGRDDRR